MPVMRQHTRLARPRLSISPPEVVRRTAVTASCPGRDVPLSDCEVTEPARRSIVWLQDSTGSGMQPVAIGIFCKAPAAGQSKTRLSPPLRPDECARLSWRTWYWPSIEFRGDAAAGIMGCRRKTAGGERTEARCL